MNSILYHSVKLNCASDEAFALFTQNDKLQQWLTMRADIVPVVGGKFELFWNPEDKENDSTIGCRITAIEEGKLLAFEWKGPKQYRDFMNTADPLTHVVILFFPCAKKRDQTPCTEVHLIHSGWRNSEKWEEARLWFEKAWNVAFEKLSLLTQK